MISKEPTPFILFSSDCTTDRDCVRGQICDMGHCVDEPGIFLWKIFWLIKFERFSDFQPEIHF